MKLVGATRLRLKAQGCSSADIIVRLRENTKRKVKRIGGLLFHSFVIALYSMGSLAV